MEVRYVGLSEEGKKYFLYEADRKTKFRQVLWGDFLSVDGEEPDGWLRVVWGRKSPTPKELFIPKQHTVETRPLEIIFVDVGQGDGAVLVTPETGDDERIMVIDAGEGDNMCRFLNARFRAYRGFDFDAAVITHPDKDHYLGFKAVFADHDIGFETIFQNGLVERPVSGDFAKVGGLVKDPVTAIQYLAGELAEDDDLIEELFSDEDENGRFVFPGVMQAALENPKIKRFRMLSTAHGERENERTYMPGFAPSDDRGYTIEVLGPVVELDANDRPRLRRIGKYSETKNGHSVLLRLEYGDFRILFGGDLNDKAEKFLLAHYAGLDEFPKEGSQDYKDMIADASRTFRADIMKVCHHGSEKVTDAFLETVNPACFIISSGDEEGHVHPRPDLLGRLGRFGRGAAPVLLSTELQRSTRELEDQDAVDDLNKDIGKLAEDPSDELLKDVQDRVKALARTNVSVYGAIYLKTDGERLITAFRIETGSQTDKWFYFEYAFDQQGQLELVEH